MNSFVNPLEKFGGYAGGDRMEEVLSLQTVPGAGVVRRFHRRLQRDERVFHRRLRQHRRVVPPAAAR